MSDDHPLLCHFKFTLVHNLQLLKEVLLVSDEDVKIGCSTVVDQLEVITSNGESSG